jgi:hypothetical protein
MALKPLNPRFHGSSFQPYGIALPASLLERLGAQPVRYGVAEDFDAMTEAEKPFFQARGGSDPAKSWFDWSYENEHRLIGDLDLTSVKDQVIALVPTEEIALKVREATGYKVIPLYC